MGDARRHEGRAIAAALAIALCLSVVVAWPASANFGGVFPTDEESGTAIETIASNQNLFAYALTDIQGGDICIVPAALEDPGNGSLNCLTPAWGSSNRVIGIGSTWTLIETPYLRAGHWKLLGDGGSKQSVDVFSNDFTVLPCEPGACDRRLADETAARYKGAAGQMAVAMGGMKQTLKVMTKVAPSEPFDHFKNALNTVVKSSLEDAPLYKRVIADKITRKLKFATQIPSGPHAMALAIAHQVNADALEMYLDIVNDPPAPYDTVAPPEFDVPVLSSGDPQLDGLMLDVAQMAGYGAAGRKAFERYQLAATDDSEAGVHRQAAAMGRNTGQLASEMWSAAVGLNAWADKLEADPEWAGAKVVQEHVDDLLPFIQRVRASGFDADERQGFQDAGLDDEAIAKLRAELTADDLDEVRVDVPIQDVVRDAAADLREQAPVFDEIAREAEAVAQSTNAAPVASFDATPASGAPPLQVTFRDTSTHGDDDPLTIRWDFGDGSPEAEGAEVTHTFAAGTYEVTQTVSDGVSTSTATRTIVAIDPSNQPPVADAGPDVEVDEGVGAHLDASGSKDPDGTIVKYVWDFGDGSAPVEAGPTTSHAYGVAGDYTVRVVVTDDDGATAEDTTTVRVGNRPPSISLSPYPRAPVGRTRPYAAYVSTGQGEQTHVEVDFGDGSAPAEREITESAQSSFDHAYASAGDYDVTFTVTDGSGETATATQTVRVQDAVADAGADVTVDEGETVTLGGDSTAPDTYTTLTWDFGDGSSPGSGTKPEHVFRDDGVYTAKVTVKDDAATVTDEVRVTVRNVAPGPMLTTSSSAETGKPVAMRGVARDPGADDQLTFSWTFGDGTSATGRRVSHAYAAAGTYTVKLRVEDGDGGSATDETTVVVGGPRDRRDSRGTDFWLSFPTNYSQTPELTLFVAGETATTGRVEIPGLAWRESFTVTPGEVTAVKLPGEAQLDRAAAPDPEDLGIHVRAASEVSVYGLNRLTFTTDAFVGLPTDALGTDYRVISYKAYIAPPEASVVAAFDDTTVTITPSTAMPGHPAGVPFDVQLDMGEAYQLLAEEDLTGTRIVANRPVAAFGAHQCANVPVTAVACDHLVEQLTPVDTWGRSFVTMPLATRTGGDTFRILASEDGTVVKIDGVPVATLGAGEFHEQLIDGAASVEASKPVLVVQYSNGSSFDNTTSDPFMTIVPPYEQFQSSYTVATPNHGFSANFLNIVVPAKAKGDVVLDGVAIPEAEFAAIGASGFAGAQVKVEPGSHRITSGSPFGVTVYGYDTYESYGYGGGFALAEVASVTQLALTPATETLDTGSEGCVEARGTDSAGAPVPDVRVDFTVAGKHARSGFVTTGVNGVARYCWRGTNVGDDTVTASVGALSRTAVKRWREPTPPGDPVDPGPVVDPAPPVKEEPKQEVKGESSASDLVLGCTERLVVLEDVVPVGSKVRLVGVADRRFAGRTVSIVFVPSGKVVAKPKVAPDGSFTASAPLPPKRLRNSNATRYEARIGKERSLKLKLVRRMRITSIGVSGGKVVVTGTVVGPLAAKKADRAIELQRSVSCTRTESVAKAMPRANGTFRIAVDVPAGQSAAVYRLRTKVRQSAASPRAVNTFTLPRGVNF